MEMECIDALPLVPAYLDGELSEARAGMLRKHLLGCHACRGTAQDGKTLKRWFAPLAAASADSHSAFSVGVPNGFAARIARRAFAGDSGERDYRLPRPKADNVLPFVLHMTALAAALLFALAVGFGMQSRPETNLLNADSALQPVERIVEQCDQLNAAPNSTTTTQGPALQVLDPQPSGAQPTAAQPATEGSRRATRGSKGQ